MTDEADDGGRSSPGWRSAVHRRSFLRGSVAAGTIALAGCVWDGIGPGGDATPGRTATGSADWQPVTLSGPPCASLDGATFRSVERQPGGPGPGETPLRRYWTVSFADGRFEYSHTDVVETGTYTCSVEDGVATLTASRDSTLTATYDPETGVLEWDGVRYRPVEGRG